MSDTKIDFDTASRRSDAIPAESEFSREVGQSKKLMALMEVQIQSVNNSVATSFHALQDSRALLLQSQ